MDRQALKAEHDPIMMQAAEWLLALQDRKLDAKQLSAWQHWIAQDPRHQQAFDRMQSAQEKIAGAEAVPWPDAREMAADRYDGMLPVSVWKTATGFGDASRRRRRNVSWAALAVAAGFSGFLLFAGFNGALTSFYGPTFTTQIGELRRLPLADGSILTMGGDSSIAVDYSSKKRAARLINGEAYFEVARDPKRPFIVDAGGTAVTALGTAFEVRRTGEQITVAVAEGVVEVKADKAGSAHVLQQLAAGQQLRVGPKQTSAPLPLARNAIATWREGRRQYRAEPLANVIADLGRYSLHRIEITDPVIGGLAITGTIFERDVDKWLNSLERALPVRVRTQADGSVVIDRARGGLSQ